MDNRREFLRTLGIGAVALVSGGLSGCGFQPVYGPRSRSGADVSSDLSAVQISTGTGREGQLLQNLLLDRFNPRGRPRNPAARLESTIDVSTQRLGTQLDETTVRARLIVQVNATLSQNATGESWSFASGVTVGFSTTEEVYAARVAEQGALEQALRAVADDLRLQIATFYEKRRLLRR